MRWIHKVSLSLLLGMSASQVSAGDMVNGVYQWDFLSGQAWPGGYDRNTGKPQNLIWARSEYSDEFYQRINNALPESEVNEAFLTDDDGATIHMAEDGEVFVTFIHEGAGYKNSFGFFTFDRENPPQSKEDVDVTIVFPNLSYPHMANGHRVSIGNFDAGTSIGFFIAANGYSWWTGVKDHPIPYYYSLNNLNPENDPVLRQHNVALYDEEVSEVIIGFEDLPRTWGDNDFNDAVFSVKATPATAIDSSTLVEMPDVNDSDADGIADEQDEFPNDYQRAYSSYYPSADSYVTLAFEDNWPKMGDYDMNDLVVRERLQTIYNAEGGITGIKLHGHILARGGAKANGFGMRLLNQSADLIGEASIIIDGQTYGKSAEAYQSDAVITLWSNTKVFTNTGGSGSCSHFNTVKSCDYFEPVPFTLDVRFSSAINSLQHSDLDFFIYRTNRRGHEIHFAGYPPTDLADLGLFGKHADTSDVDSGRYYKNADNLPWGLKLNTDWLYPREYIDVVWAYPDYEAWVESSGQENQNWYSTSNRIHHYYTREQE